MRITTNEVQIVEDVIKARGISKSNLSRRIGISPQNLFARLNSYKGEKLRMSVCSLEQILKAMDYQIVVMPNWLARETVRDNTEAMLVKEVEEE